MGLQPLKEKNNLISSLHEQLLAGKASKSKKELEQLYDQFIKAFSTDIMNELVGENYNITGTWLKNFVIVNQDNFADGLMYKTEPAAFYEWGNYLLNKQKEKPDAIPGNIIHEYLNLFRHSPFLTKIYEEKKWEFIVYDLIKISNYNLDVLFRQRVRDYGDKTLFKIIRGKEASGIKWKEVNERVNEFACSIYNLIRDENLDETKVTFLLENCPEMPLLDLACLTNGIVNVMIPANSVSEHIKYIINQTNSSLLFVYDEKHLSKIKFIRNELPGLKRVVLLKGTSAEEWVISFDEFIKQGKEIKNDELNELKSKININSLATIMYTSGTTGEPKGIMFSQMNIVYKRFCRAMALPEIGDADRFLAYLPLYHTFGRWLEMIGSIFWSAEYCFMENPSLDTMIANMQLVKPTIFISIPKKWIQLFEFISDNVDLEMDEQDKISNVVKTTTGGTLKWGLSAAGYLPPDIFRFFQAYGIELMSGFGMTEATGGITMTPPGKYKENSLGKALPGIELKIADDGEILIKGHYVMMGYFGTSKDETFTDGWLPTGDIMKMDDEGFIEIVDRKKEIYKNVKGETIAPQKIENYFNEFDSVKQVFLAGDHKPFNTVLIYPDYESENVPLKEMSEQQKQEYFSSLVVTVNKFLAPFERIVDFRIIDREFSASEGELTPKGTYKRNVIGRNFSDLIDTMYKLSYISIVAGNVEVRIPTWFLREKGSLNRDIVPKDEGIEIPKIHSSLIIKKINGEQNLFRVGSFIYKIDSPFVDMQTFFTNPSYWLGNKELLDFTGEVIFQWYRQSTAQTNLQYHSTVGRLSSENKPKEKLQQIYINGEISLNGLHLSALLLQSENADDHAIAISFLQKILSDDTNHHYKLALEIASRPNLTQLLDTKRSLFKAAAQKLKQDKFEKIFKQYLKLNYDFINNSVIDYLVETRRGDEIPDLIEHLLTSEVEKLEPHQLLEQTSIPSLLNLVEKFGIHHPVSFQRIRRFLMRFAVFGKSDTLKEQVDSAINNLTHGLREWLGKNQSVAVDLETGEEYRWEDVLTFEEGIYPEDRLRIKNALIKTSVLREAVFLFSKGVLLRLDNILPGGIWISHLETKPNKSIYRLTLQTRFQGAFEITIHLAHDIPPAQIQEEIKWLILPATTTTGERLLPKFGGYWKEYELWTEEFVPRESVKKFIQKTVRKKDETQLQRLFFLWPYFVWNAAAAYMNFWKLTNYKIELANPLPENISIPTHDYQTGTLLYSVSQRIKSDSVADFFKNFYLLFVKGTVDKYSFLEKKSIWNYIFSGVMEVEGEEKGINMLKQFREELKTGSQFPDKEIVLERTNLFIRNIRLNGYIPKSLFFAIKRFLRWFKLNKNASFTAQAEMLYELYDTYHLFKLEESHPSTRTVFFMETAFIDSQETFKNALQEIANKQRNCAVSKDETLNLISSLQTHFNLSEKEKFFLTRLSYPYLKPTDSATLLDVKTEESASNLVVQLIDNDSNPFLIRSPTSPKEISRLHQLFFESNLDVHFRPAHNFLVAISERGFIIGGLFYNRVDDQTVHMEKIVVSDRYRRKGISEGLMNELFNRMRNEHLKYVTTGFFRPEYFYKFGFKIEKKYSGLVKDLWENDRK